MEKESPNGFGKSYFIKKYFKNSKNTNSSLLQYKNLFILVFKGYTLLINYRKGARLFSYSENSHGENRKFSLKIWGREINFKNYLVFSVL